MSTKLPWDLDKYVPPCTDVFKTEDKKEDDEANETKVDEYEDGVTSQPVYLDKYLDGLMKEKDTGAGEKLSLCLVVVSYHLLLMSTFL